MEKEALSGPTPGLALHKALGSECAFPGLGLAFELLGPSQAALTCHSPNPLTATATEKLVSCERTGLGELGGNSTPPEVSLGGCLAQQPPRAGGRQRQRAQALMAAGGRVDRGPPAMAGVRRPGSSVTHLLTAKGQEETHRAGERKVSFLSTFRRDRPGGNFTRT